MSNIIYALLIATFLFIVFIGWKYAHLAYKTSQNIKNKKLNVEKNMHQPLVDDGDVHQFWISDCSGSMHEQKVFVVSPSDLGL